LVSAKIIKNFLKNNTPLHGFSALQQTLFSHAGQSYGQGVFRQLWRYITVVTVNFKRKSTWEKSVKEN
jgi:adenine-specific DNA methylase